MWKPYSKTRIVIALFGFTSAIFLPWWVPAIVILTLACIWRSWEAILLGLFVDLLWLPTHEFPFFAIGAIVAVWILEPIRKEFLVR